MARNATIRSSWACQLAARPRGRQLLHQRGVELGLLSQLDPESLQLLQELPGGGKGEIHGALGVMAGLQHERNQRGRGGGCAGLQIHKRLSVMEEKEDMCIVCRHAFLGRREREETDLGERDIDPGVFPVDLEGLVQLDPDATDRDEKSGLWRGEMGQGMDARGVGVRSARRCRVCFAPRADP